MSQEAARVPWYIIGYKLLLGGVELFFGLAMILFGRRAAEWYQAYAAQELAEDPHDLLVRLTHTAVPGLLTHHSLLAFYLILLGGAKVAGAIGLIYGQTWGVDLLVGLTIVMLPFQVIRLLMHPSLPDFLYITVGLLIALYLIDFKPHVWAKRVHGSVHRRLKVKVFPSE